MEPVFPSPVKTWHNDTYPALSPTRPELAVDGKTVIITGAGGVIGREIARAFAQAGAKHVALVGRDLKALGDTKAALPSTTEVSTLRADITSAEEMGAVASEVGTWDVLILGAGHMPKPGYLTTMGVEDFWSAFEVNTKSVVITVQALVPRANPERAVVLGLFPGAMCLPAAATGGLSAYMASKMAQAKLLEYVAAENSHVFAAAVHPGMVDSPLFRASGATPDMLPMDTARLAAHFVVWMASQEAHDLRGKLVWANWDVEELKLVASKAKAGSEFTVGTLGWPYSSNEGNPT